MPEIPIGQIAVDQGLISAEQRDSALKLQADLRKQDLYMRIGEIFARRTLLQPSQVRELLDKQELVLVRCRNCGKQFNARNWSAGRGSCPCGGDLDMAPPEAPLSVSGNAAMSKVDDHAPNKPASEPGSLRGRYFGKYPLQEELGRGAMGLVYKAHDPALGRPIAIKVLIDAGTPDESAKRRHQFLQEARSAAKLRHASIVSVHEVGQSEGTGYFTMDYIDGAPLSTLIKEDGAGGRPLAFENSSKPLLHVVEWIRDVAMALQHAHQAGLLHCDVKPGNILIDRRNKALLSDFSAARGVRFNKGDPNSKRVLGTLLYMSPEQAKGAAKEVGTASDIWACGAVLYVLLTGKRPFAGDTAIEIRKAICLKTAIAPRVLNADIPRDLEAIVLKCLQKDPKARYATANELADDLQRYMDGKAVTAPVAKKPGLQLWKDRRAWAVVAAGVVLIVAVIGVKMVIKSAVDKRAAKFELPEDSPPKGP